MLNDVRAVAPRLDEFSGRLDELSGRLDEFSGRLDGLARDTQGLDGLVRQVDLRVNHFQQFDFRLQKLRELAS